jgi:CheY-like chemotaxis protein
MSDDAAQCLGAGCDAYLAKPIRGETLIADVARWTTPGFAHEPIQDAVAEASTVGPDEEMLESELPERPEMQELLAAYRVSIVGSRSA